MRPLALMIALLASPVAAWPVDWIHDVAAGKEKFIRLPKLDWFEVEDPRIASVEWLDGSQELLVTGLKPGRTLVLLGAEGRVAVWRVRVGASPLVEPSAFAVAQKACGGVQSTPLEDVKLRVHLRDEGCRRALLALFETDAFAARDLELTFEVPVLQEQLKRLSEGLKGLSRAPIGSRYVGAGLILEGTVTELEHRRVLWEVFRRTVGRVALEDRLEVSPSDGGAK